MHIQIYELRVQLLPECACSKTIIWSTKQQWPVDKYMVNPAKMFVGEINKNGVVQLYLEVIIVLR